MNPFAIEAKIRDLADRAAVEFLSPLSEKRGSPEWVSKNAEAILAESGKDLTEIAIKIAREENLNPHEVARLAEESNKEVFLRLYKGADDKTFEFKVADASRILAALDRPYEGPGDLFLPVEHPKVARMQKAASDQKIDPTTWAKTALRPSEHQKLQLSLEEEKIAQESFQELAFEAASDRHQAALDFLKIGRDLVLEGGRTPSDLFAMVKEARPGSASHEKAARELLALVALDTGTRFPEGAREVVKFANALLEISETGGGEQPSDELRHVTQENYEFWTADPGLRAKDFVGPASSAGDPVVVNDRHKLFLTLDTLIDQTNKENWYGKGLLFSGDRVRSVVRNVVNWTPKNENVI